MSSSFACDLETFKKAVAKFVKHASDDSVTADALDQAFKLVGLYYLNRISASPSDDVIAASYYEFAARHKIDRETDQAVKTPHLEIMNDGRRVLWA